MDFEWYRDTVRDLTDDHRINIHLLNKKKFRDLEKMYSPRLPV